MKRLAATIAMLMTTAIGSVASAQSVDALTVGYQPAWFVLGGATGGASFGSTSNGGYLGAEVSVARLLRGWWYGLYADAEYDFGMGTPTVSLGPEFGYWVLGVDGGVGIRPGEDETFAVGPRIRGLLTVGLVSLYYRHAYWPGDRENRTVRQVGLLLKLPLSGSWGTGEAPPANMGKRRQ